MSSSPRNACPARYQVLVVGLSWLAMSRKSSGDKLRLNIRLSKLLRRKLFQNCRITLMCFGRIVSLKYRLDFSHGSPACLQMEEFLLPIYAISAAGEVEQNTKYTKWRRQYKTMAANVRAIQNGVRKEFLLICSQVRHTYLFLVYSTTLPVNQATSH